jgi:hypothetical protein
MKSIIGLFENDDSVRRTIERLEAAGIPRGRIQQLSDLNKVNKILGCDPICVVQSYTFGGAAVGVAIYSIFGLAAAFCECNLMQFGREYGIFAFLGAILAGTVIGGIIGSMLGIGEVEKDTHLYIQGVRTGSKVIAVEVADGTIEDVKTILSVERALGVRMIEPGGV